MFGGEFLFSSVPSAKSVVSSLQPLRLVGVAADGNVREYEQTQVPWLDHLWAADRAVARWLALNKLWISPTSTGNCIGLVPLHFNLEFRHNR